MYSPSPRTTNNAMINAGAQVISVVSFSTNVPSSSGLTIAGSTG